MKEKVRQEHSIENVFIFVLLGVFAVFSMVMVLLGVRAYRSMGERADENNITRLLSSYVRSMVRSEDGLADIRVESGSENGIADGSDVLVFEEDFDGDVYLTRIYVYDGFLREWFSEEAYAFNPAQGDEICEAGAFRAAINGSLLSVELESAAGQAIRSDINLYARGEGRDYS